jgi:riboflavin biosynthesis pyrimidine reductase
MSTSLQPLGPSGAPHSAADLVTRMGLWDDPGHAERPRVVVAMIGSADGRATVEGRAGGLGSPADRSVLRELRCAASALLVGSATLIKERYATLLDPPQQDARLARGLPREPLLATISRGLDPRLPEIALFAEPEQRIVVYTEAEGAAPSHGAQVDKHRFDAGGLNARACLRHLRLELGATVVVSEGGPTLLRELLAEGLVDDLVLTVAPTLVAGEGRSIVHGPVFDPPLGLELREVLRAGGPLFLHYVPAAA